MAGQFGEDANQVGRLADHQTQGNSCYDVSHQISAEWIQN